MPIWFVRMRAGAGGWDFTQLLWEQNMVGVMFGNWTENDVTDPVTGRIDPNRVTLQWLRHDCDHPTADLRPRDMPQIQAFVCSLPGDAVIVNYNQALHIGTLGDQFNTRQHDNGLIQCRSVNNRREFRFADLPAAFRLLQMTGRATIQQVRAFRPYAKLLRDHETADLIRHHLDGIDRAQLLDMLSPEQWETLCEEYLRDILGYRNLLVARGRTLNEVDLVGVSRDGQRILAQCKNLSASTAVNDVAAWADRIGRAQNDRVLFFNRGGFHGGALDNVELVCGAQIEQWLEDNAEYFNRLRVV